MKLYTVVITGRKQKVIVRDPGAKDGVRQVEDTSPMRCHYFSEAVAIEESPRLKKVLDKNPDAQVELPDGEKMPLKEWIETAGKRHAPSYVSQHPEKLGLPLGDLPEGYGSDEKKQA